MMQLTALIAAAQAAPPSLADTVPYMIGMILVLVTLSTLWGICIIIAKIIAIIQPPGVPAPAPIAAATPQAPADDQIPPHIIAVIAAAVTATAGRAHRIISINPTKTSWEKAGRQSILTSHKIR